MALIYTKLADKTTVMAPREGGCRQFNFGTDWTEVRVGMFCSSVAATGSNDSAVAETLVTSGVGDYCTFGIKDDSQTYPGQAGSLFLGVKTLGANVISSVWSGGGGGILGNSASWEAIGYHDTTLVTAGGGLAGSRGMGEANSAASSAYCCFMAVKIIINNLGLSTQTVTMRAVIEQNVAGTDYSATALRTELNNASYGSGLTFAWNDGAAARAIPDCVWVRTPLFLNTLRISAIRAIRYAP